MTQSQSISTKPYLSRAIHEWCLDNGFTPHLLVAVNSQTRVPLAYVKNGEIVLNLSYSATKDLHIDNEQITFSARFGGISQSLYVPMSAVKGIFARENGQGLFFEIEPDINEAKAEIGLNLAHQSPNVDQKQSDLPSNIKKPALKIVK